MTFDLKGGSGVFSCDTCPDSIDTEQDNFTDALIVAKHQGWRTYKGPDKQWAHACPACTREYATEQAPRRGP